MAFKKGQVANPKGGNAPGRKAVTRVQNALNMALDHLEVKQVKYGDKTASQLAVLIAEAMEKDIIAAIKGLSPILPKDVNIGITRHTSADSLTDEELADIIAERARARHDNEKEVEGEVVDNQVVNE